MFEEAMFLLFICCREKKIRFIYKRYPEGKRPFGRPRHRRDDNIKMDLQEVGVRVWTGSKWLRIGTGSGHL